MRWRPFGLGLRRLPLSPPSLNGLGRVADFPRRSPRPGEISEEILGGSALASIPKLSGIMLSAVAGARSSIRQSADRGSQRISASAATAPSTSRSSCGPDGDHLGVAALG